MQKRERERREKREQMKMHKREKRERRVNTQSEIERRGDYILGNRSEKE